MSLNTYKLNRAMVTTPTELPPALRAHAERLNEEFKAICAPFDALTADQQRAALMWFVGWIGSAAVHGDTDAKACFDGALEAARGVE
jgi:hypothetical protein